MAVPAKFSLSCANHQSILLLALLGALSSSPQEQLPSLTYQKRERKYKGGSFLTNKKKNHFNKNEINTKVKKSDTITSTLVTVPISNTLNKAQWKNSPSY